jgi:hypothetical protein
MTLFTKTQTEQLIANCQAQIVRMDNRESDIDFKPVVRLFTILRLAGPFGLPVLARRRRVKGVTSTRLSAFGRCHVHVARRPVHLPPHWFNTELAFGLCDLGLGWPD